jgi:hypothetical protein
MCHFPSSHSEKYVAFCFTFESLSPFSSVHPFSATLDSKSMPLAVLPKALVVASTAKQKKRTRMLIFSLQKSKQTLKFNCYKESFCPLLTFFPRWQKNSFQANDLFSTFLSSYHFSFFQMIPTSFKFQRVKKGWEPLRKYTQFKWRIIHFGNLLKPYVGFQLQAYPLCLSDNVCRHTR